MHAYIRTYIHTCNSMYFHVIYIYIKSPCFSAKVHSQVQYMARALTSGTGAGSTIALLLHAFDRADREHHQIIERCLAPQDWQLDHLSLVIGLFIGCLIYPIIEALPAYRWLVLQAAAELSSPSSLDIGLTDRLSGSYEQCRTEISEGRICRA